LWEYRFDQPVRGGVLPEIGEDGSAYAISENDRLYALNPDGTLRYQVDLPTGLFQMDPAEPVYGSIWPFVLPDGTVLIVSERDTVYAIGPEGEVAWEHELEARLAEHPTLTKDGIVYLVDEQGGLSAFVATGFRWRFQSQAASRPANSAVAGPDGKVYYTVTDLSRGFVQAVSPDGQGLWVTQAETGAIYEYLQVSPDGTLVFLKEDVFSAENGQLLDFETPVRVSEYIMGRDGRTYLQSGHSVIQWQLGPDGFEELQTTTWDHSRLGNFPPLISVDANQIYWVNYFETLLWMAPDGRVLNTFKPAPLAHYDLDHSRLIECRTEPGSEDLVCSAFAPGETEPVWQGRVSGVPDFDFGQARLIEGYLYVLGEGQTLYKFWIGEPDGN
jgi:outer membrane protein assembly factor BamB